MIVGEEKGREGGRGKKKREEKRARKQRCACAAKEDADSVGFFLLVSPSKFQYI